MNDVRGSPVSVVGPRANSATTASVIADSLKQVATQGRYGHTTDVASLVAFLAGPESGYITGANLTVPFATADAVAHFDVPEYGWTFFAGLARPRSRGRIELTGAGPDDADVRTHMALAADARAVDDPAGGGLGEEAHRRCTFGT